MLHIKLSRLLLSRSRFVSVVNESQTVVTCHATAITDAFSTLFIPTHSAASLLPVINGSLRMLTIMKITVMMTTLIYTLTYIWR